MAKKSERDGEGKSNDSPTERHFNLLYAPWIPVLWRDGRAERVGIKAALTKAGKIRQIAATNPMDNVALLRFLLAVLLWCKPDAKEALGALLDADPEAPGIPEDDWLGKLDRHQPAFELLGAGERFYQDKQILDGLLEEKQQQWDKEKKEGKVGKKPRPTQLDDDDFRPIGDLLIEFPTETKASHLCHIQDKAYGVCLSCCALGLIRFSSWANAYGGGRYTSAVNGPTPAYAVGQGKSLLETLRLASPDTKAETATPPWMSAYGPTAKDLHPVTVLAWRSRRLWLGGLSDAKPACAYCGESGRLLHQLAFSGNWKPPFETKGQQKKFWDKDPHLIVVAKRGSTAEEAEDDSELGEDSKRGSLTTLGFPAPGFDVAAHSTFWRRALRGLSKRNCDQAISIAGPAANKGLYQDSASLVFQRLPEDLRERLSDNARQAVFKHVRDSSPNPKRLHPEIKAATVLLTPEAEKQVRAALANADAKAGTPDAYKQFLRDIYQSVVEQVVDGTSKGSPLRRRAAKSDALDLLRKNIDAIVDKANQPAGAAEGDAQEKSAEAKRGRKKKGNA